MHMVIRNLGTGDLAGLKALITVFGQVFDMQNLQIPHDAQLSELLQQDHFFAVVAEDSAQVVGGLTGYILPPYYNTRALAYIHDLAVLPDYQRKGIGRQLIRHINGHCRQLGCEGLFVQAETADAYAVDFYRSTMPDEELLASHFYYKFDQEA